LGYDAEFRASSASPPQNSITVPHAMGGQQWKGFNSGTGNATLVCDSGTINGAANLFLSSLIGKPLPLTVRTVSLNRIATYRLGLLIMGGNVGLGEGSMIPRVDLALQKSGDRRG
jgi:hypothetical protein